MSNIELKERPERALEKRTYRIGEAVQAYGISRATLYRCISAGQLKPTKLGSITLIPRTQLDALVGIGEAA